MTRSPGGGSLALIPVVLLAWIAAASWLDAASHGRVALQVLACNAVLMACAGAAALGYVWPAMAGAGLAVAVLLAILERRGRPAA